VVRASISGFLVKNKSVKCVYARTAKRLYTRQFCDMLMIVSSSITLIHTLFVACHVSH
jgi:hypothetical protein